jgi:NAD(P)-dependent dehydrogenase (short-subunit alcohol dehydrogenase family)
MSRQFRSIVIIGKGAIGKAFISELSSQHPEARIHVLSRQFKKDHTNQSNITEYRLNDYSDESLKVVADRVTKEGGIDCVLVATGLLHSNDIQPEKSMKEISKKSFEKIFEANTFVPAFAMKYFLPHLNKVTTAVFAVLSARLGSISDNHLGGWYAYRASKSALNMIIKTASIEAKRTHPQAIILGLHPGTVDSKMTQPFQKNIKKTLFQPEESVKNMLRIINNVSIDDSGKCIDWEGKEILP